MIFMRVATSKCILMNKDEFMRMIIYCRIHFVYNHFGRPQCDGIYYYY